MAPSGFSMVELVMALGIASFALVIILALLPVGMMSNRASNDELHAANLLSIIYADLRNTDPRLASVNPLNPGAGKSLVYGLELPYQVSSAAVLLNQAITAVNTPTLPVPANCTVGIDSFDNPAALGTPPPAAYQASVIYTEVPGAAAVCAPIHARLIVSWPALGNSATVCDLTNPGKVKGYVESYVTFPAP